MTYPVIKLHLGVATHLHYLVRGQEQLQVLLLRELEATDQVCRRCLDQESRLVHLRGDTLLLERGLLPDRECRDRELHGQELHGQECRGQECRDRECRDQECRDWERHGQRHGQEWYPDQDPEVSVNPKK